MFETKIRDNGETFTVLADERPEWLYDAVHEAHNGEFPDDWRYAMCATLWAHIVDCSNGDASFDPTDLDTDEIGDQFADIYTASLLTWYANDMSRTEYADQIIEESGPYTGTTTELLLGGQARAIARMATVLVDAAHEAYSEYQFECDEHSVYAHTFHGWTVHGCPAGPLG